MTAQQTKKGGNKKMRKKLIEIRKKRRIYSRSNGE